GRARRRQVPAARSSPSRATTLLRTSRSSAAHRASCSAWPRRPPAAPTARGARCSRASRSPAGLPASCFAGKLLQRAPDRVVAAVFHQTVGHRPEDPDVMVRHSHDNWLPDFKKRRPEVSDATIEKFFHSLWRAQPDFLYSVSRDFIKNCKTPILVLPDDTPSHPLQSSIDVASLAPNSEITVFPWREPEELRQRIIQKVRTFLKSHLPLRAAAQ